SLALVPQLATAEPTPAEVPVVTEVTERPDGVTVDWTVPAELAAEAVLYEVTANIVSEDEDVDGDLGGHAIVPADVRSVSLTGLDAEDDYEVRVQPGTPEGRSEASAPVAAALDAEGPAATVADAPADVVVDAGSGTAGVDAGRVRVSWAP